jgi:hypothetical protein
MDKLVGYVCNNKKCSQYGHPKYLEHEPKLTIECPYCKVERTEMIEEVYKEPTENIQSPAVKLNNGKYYG